MDLKDYQINAIYGNDELGIDSLLDSTIKGLKVISPREPKKILLQAITGAGKTVIASHYISVVYKRKDKDRKLVTIWLSKGTGGLHTQSGKSIKKYIGNEKNIKIYNIEKADDFTTNQFKDGDVYVLNWEKFKEDSMLLDSEHHCFKIALNNTKNVDYLVIIDEYHTYADTLVSKKILSMINPKVILGMTATPKSEQLGSASTKLIIDPYYVKKAGMIKEDIIFNPDINANEKKDNTSTNEYLLNKAIKKRDDLFSMYKKLGSNVNPLLLIQFDDDSKKSPSNEKIKEIIKLLEKKGFRKDIDYAVWITNNSKENLRSDENVLETLDRNGVKILLFKQAVALGWDCPRSQILLRYRRIEGSSEPFNLQTLGRIMRMPEPSRKKDNEYHVYSIEELNNAYVYTADKQTELEESMKKAFNPYDTKKGSIGSKYKEIEMQALVYKKEFETIYAGQNENPERHPLEDIEYVKAIREYVKTIYDSDVKKEIDITKTIITGKLAVEDIGQDCEIDGKREEVFTMSINELENTVNEWLLYGAIPLSFSEDIRNCFSQEIKNVFRNIAINEKMKNVDVGMLSLIHINHYLIMQKVGIPLRKKKKDATEIVFAKTVDFHFPEKIKYSIESNPRKSKKNLYGIIQESAYKTEQIFFDKFLEDNMNVVFWYKNADFGSSALCIKYTYHNTKLATYPDYIVGFKNGSFGIYEIKDIKDKREDISDKQIAIIKKVNELNIKGDLLKIDTECEIIADLPKEFY